MAHFAKVNSNNIVEQVVVLGNDLESTGSAYLAEHYGGRWIQTSYNNNIRGKFAGISDIYDEDNDIFIFNPNLNGYYLPTETHPDGELVLLSPSEYEQWLKDNNRWVEEVTND
jgi:hypothetical protein